MYAEFTCNGLHVWLVSLWYLYFGFVMTGLSFVFVQEILLDNSVLVGPCALLILNSSSLQWCF